MRFNGLTNQGKAYLAKIQANQSAIKFKKIVIGDGRLDEHDNPLELKSLINKKFEKGIISKEQKGDIVTLLTYVDNVSLSQGYYPREIGVYVDDNGVEVLYYYMNDGDETSWVPPESYGPFKIELKLNIIASNSDSIIVNNLAKEMYVSKDYVDTQLKKKEDVISKGSAFNKNYGITKGTTLEGDKYSVMEGIAGDKINPGFIQDSGEKKENKFYLDKNTGRLYRCLKTTQSTTNSSEFFKDVSLANINDKLDNLFSFDGHQNIEFKTGGIRNSDANSTETKITFDVPFKNKLLFVVITDDVNKGQVPIVSGARTDTFTKNGFAAVHDKGIEYFTYMAIGY